MSDVGKGTAGQLVQATATGTKYTTAIYPATAGTAGKVLISDGTNIISSTPTFPNASATTRKIIVSDGTNWVASTETYAVPGTSGNVMTSDGNNWVSSAAPGGGVLTVTGTLTNSQIKNIRATPVEVIAAPAAGTYIQVIASTAKLNYGGTTAFTLASGALTLKYDNNVSLIQNLFTTSNITATTTTIAIYAAPAALSGASTLFDNKNIAFQNSGAVEITGNVANDNTISYSITYRLVTI